MYSRIIINTWKQIRRSGWVAWSSIAVMILAFFVATIFGGMAFLANLYIRYIETRDNVLVFFEVGMDEGIIETLHEKWENLSEIKEIGFTSEDDAYESYLAETEKTKPIEYQLLLQDEQKKLPSSLDIRLNTLDDLNKIRRILVDDINTELAEMEYDPNEPPIHLEIDDQNLEEFRDVFSFMRVGGFVVLSLLFVIIFFFTLMTVEYRTYNRMEEIGVMQLVGGSLWYIRAPYILEGGFYGAMGALFAGLTLGGIYLSAFVLSPDSNVSVFIIKRLSILDLPYVTLPGMLLMLFVEVLIGFFLGVFSSYLAIRRYIK